MESDRNQIGVHANEQKLVFYFCSGAAVVSFVLVLLHLLLPAWRRMLFAEDHIVEAATALGFLVALILASRSLSTDSSRHRTDLFAIATIGLVAFLDEISFGARFLDLSMPQMAGGGEFDGVHDLLIIVHRNLQWAPLLVTCAAIAAVAALMMACWFHQSLISVVVLAWHDRLKRTYLCMFGLVSVALILDLEIELFKRLGALEELCELNAAWALVLASIVIGRRRTKGSKQADEIHRALQDA